MAERGKIFVKTGNGRPEPVEDAPFDTEKDLQELVADYPELLAGEQMAPEDPRRWILIKREKGIADRPGAADRWSVDHLMIDQNAVPTLIEAKRSSSSEIRRKIVGQMLDYAAHATGTWSVAEMREIFESGEANPEDTLGKLLKTEEPDADAFWENVATNLAAKRMRLLFVADGIPDELARVVEFLNEQMPHIEVLAVEVTRFKGESSEILVPRVIGRLSGRRNRSRRRLTRDEFLGKFEAASVRDAARRLLDVAGASGASIFFGTKGVSIRAHCPLFSQPVTVAWIYPPSSPGWMKVRDFTFGAGNGTSNGLKFGMELPDDLEERLRHWAEEFRDGGFDDASSEGVEAYSLKPGEAVENIDLLESRMSKVIADIAILK